MVLVVSYCKSTIAVLLVGLLLMLSGDIETNPGPGPPTVRELAEELHDLSDWEGFAIHLPGIEDHDIEKISNDYRTTDRRKLRLYSVWLGKCPDASWDHVLKALDKTKEGRTLATKICKNKDLPPTASKKLTAVTNDHELTLRGTENEATDGTEEFESHINKAKGRRKKYSQHESNSPNHLAIVITNTYRNTEKLSGVVEDRKELYLTFDKSPHFDLIKAKDYKSGEMKNLKDEVQEMLQKKHPASYKSVFIVFSGHGGKGTRGQQILQSNDDHDIDADEFIEKYKTIIGRDVPKYFLIDACRGNLGLAQNKGPGDNCLIAYSTEDDHVAKCHEKDGSFWIIKVAEQLRKVRDADELHLTDSVVRAIKQANEDLIKDTSLPFKQIPDIAENSIICA